MSKKSNIRDEWILKYLELLFRYPKGIEHGEFRREFKRIGFGGLYNDEIEAIEAFLIGNEFIKKVDKYQIKITKSGIDYLLNLKESSHKNKLLVDLLNLLRKLLKN